LIGKKLGEFYFDFLSLDGSESFAMKSIFCGKKIYMDKVMNENGLLAFHTRMKGVRSDVIGITANKLYPKLNQIKLRNGIYYPIWGKEKTLLNQLDEDLLKGQAIDFDLCDSTSPNFNMMRNFSIETKSSLIKNIQYSQILV
jgi:hypothetical protein